MVLTWKDCGQEPLRAQVREWAGVEGGMVSLAGTYSDLPSHSKIDTIKQFTRDGYEDTLKL
jgi:hypothetical protein